MDMVKFYKRVRPRPGVIAFLRRLWIQARCPHTHCAKFDLDGAVRVYGDPFGSRTSKVCGLQLCCCYKCGLVWVRDWAA